MASLVPLAVAPELEPGCPMAEADWTETFDVEPQYAGLRLDQFLAVKLRRASRSQVARILRGGMVRYADGRQARAGQRVCAGQRIVVPRRERMRADSEAAFAGLCILAEGDSWLVLDKPAGMLVHRTAHEATCTVERWLLLCRPGQRWEPVHRLDRDTSGVLVCGQGSKAISALRGAFAQGSVEKTYLALVADADCQWPLGASRQFTQPLGPAGGPVKLRIGVGDWSCATHATCIERRECSALLEVRIERGRQHQIRAHLALFGTPIVGDKLYQAGDAFFLEWIARPHAPDLLAKLSTPWHCLHASSVSFAMKHGEIMRVTSDLPSHFQVHERTGAGVV